MNCGFTKTVCKTTSEKRIKKCRSFYFTNKVWISCSLPYLLASYPCLVHIIVNNLVPHLLFQVKRCYFTFLTGERAGILYYIEVKRNEFLFFVA